MRGKKKEKKDVFCTDCGDYCFDSYEIDDWIQCLEFKV
jgi:hypothetical protein